MSQLYLGDLGQAAPVTEFRGEFRFLSNFHPSPIELDTWELLNDTEVGALPWTLKGATVEHVYQAAKVHPSAAMNMDVVRRIGSAVDQVRRVLDAESPGDAKKLGGPEGRGGMIVLRPGRPEGLDQRLLATSPRVLIEGNTWGDTYWGVCGGTGRNMLGRCLMLVRQELNVAAAAGVPIEEVRGG
jgi:hypothetical protein